MREDAIAIFRAGVQSVQPQNLMPQHIRRQRDGLYLGDLYWRYEEIRNLYVIGAGKAAAAMARETELILDNTITRGLVVTKYHHALPLQYLRCVEAGHPVPDEAGLKAGAEIVQLLQGAQENDLVIALISGGASALMVDCPPGAGLSDIRNVFASLLACGADISEMNIVRKHLSPNIKGGQLARSAYPATLVSFMLSDVPGDVLESIASGPTVPDPSTYADAWKILEKYQLTYKLPVSVEQWLQAGVKGQVPDTPKPGEVIFNKSHNYLVGTNRIALDAARTMAEKLHYHTEIVSGNLAGEAREQALNIVQQILQYNGPRPACLLWGGETTVTIKGDGKGGRNQELALAALHELMKDNDLDSFPVILSAGTDGTDGPTDAAGAVIDVVIAETAIKKQLATEDFLIRNDAYHFFHQAGGHVITGPTQTNVMDLVVALVT